MSSPSPTNYICISIPELLEFVAFALIDDPGIVDHDLSWKMKVLVIGPLNRMLGCQDPQNLELKHWWLLVDGLGECEGAVHILGWLSRGFASAAR